MAITRIVKVQRPMVPANGDWLAFDERREHEEEFQPDAWMLEAMGARMQCYFMGTWSADGWIFKRRVKEKQNW